MRLPGHDADRRRDRQADQRGHRLQAQGDPILPAAEAQARQHQLALLVQVLGLDVDQPRLLAQEGVELGIGALGPAALARPDHHRRRGRQGTFVRLARALDFRLFAPLGHDAPAAGRP